MMIKSDISVLSMAARERGAVEGAAVPEPATWAMIAAGFIGFGALSWGARRRAVTA
jgi:PEP-CTERM motif